MERRRLIVPITTSGDHPSPETRVTPAVLAAELTRITPRDRQLLGFLEDHQTFTTEQITDLCFGSAGRARNRLNLLRSRGVVDRFRHYQRPGSQSWRWVLGPVGAGLVAAGRGQRPPRPSAVREATARLATSPRLRHLLATNGWFVALVAHARRTDGTDLVCWWNESRCRAAVGTVARPDGHGLWAVGDRQVPFWLEMDLGTEPIPRVVGKLTGYAHLAGTGQGHPVVFWLPTAAREANLHTHLARHGVPEGLTVATATDPPDPAIPADPAGAVWRVAGRSDRLPLVDLGGRP